jgi:hypothetical protein
MLVDMMVMVLTLLEPWRYDDGPLGTLMVWLMVMVEMEPLVDDVALRDGGAMLEMPC